MPKTVDQYFKNVVDDGSPATRLLIRRQEKEMSTQILSDKSDVGVATISRIEHGNFKRIDLEKYIKLGAALNCNPLWLAGRSDQKDVIDKKSEEAKSGSSFIELSPQDYVIFKKYKTLPEAQKKIVADLIISLEK